MSILVHRRVTLHCRMTTSITIAPLHESWPSRGHALGKARVKLLSRAFVDHLYSQLMGDPWRTGLITTGLISGVCCHSLSLAAPPILFFHTRTLFPSSRPLECLGVIGGGDRRAGARCGVEEADAATALLR